MLLGLSTHHATAVCSRETVVMALYRTHFERLFKRRNPKTLAKMATSSELQLTRRVIKPKIVDCMPLVRCLVFKLQEVKREAGKKFVAPAPSLALGAGGGLRFDLPEVTFHVRAAGDDQIMRARSQSYSWSGAVDDSSLPQVPFKPRCSLPFRKCMEHGDVSSRQNASTSQHQQRKYKYTPAPAASISLTIARMREPQSTHGAWSSKREAERNENELIYGEAKLDAWYSSKSFLPGLRSVVIGALLLSSLVALRHAKRAAAKV